MHSMPTIPCTGCFLAGLGGAGRQSGGRCHLRETARGRAKQAVKTLEQGRRQDVAEKFVRRARRDADERGAAQGFPRLPRSPPSRKPGEEPSLAAPGPPASGDAPDGNASGAQAWRKRRALTVEPVTFACPIHDAGGWSR